MGWDILFIKNVFTCIWAFCPQNNTGEETVWLCLLRRRTVKLKAVTTICLGHRAGQLQGGATLADICIGHLQFTVFSHLFTSSQFCKECDQGLPFPLLAAGRIQWPPLRTQNVSGRTRTGPSFLDSRFSARAFSGWGLFPLKSQCNRKFDWCWLVARF